MKSIYHPDFPKDILSFSSIYERLSPGLGLRFRKSVDETISAVQLSPESAGHFLNTGSEILRSYRRRNVKAFPFFIIYGVGEELIIFGAIIPSRSNPDDWLKRFAQENS